MSFFVKVKERIKKWLSIMQEENKNVEFESPEEYEFRTADKVEMKSMLVPPPAPLTDIHYQIIDRYHDSQFWAWTERLRGKQTRLIQEKFIPEIECKNEEINKHFGSAKPPSYEVLLHFLPAAEKIHPNPVLLVHGAGHHAIESWCQSANHQKGLLYPLSTSGRDVFAVTFAHSHGDNWQQAIQLANCIQRIKEITDLDKIDIIAHSKGGVSAWIYLAGLCDPFDAPYEGNVGQYVMLGTPNRGLDYPFRHVSSNWSVIQMEISAPIACDSVMYFGQYINTTERSLYRDGGAFPGSSQLLYRWDDQYPVQLKAKTLYYGGQNMFYHSRGIDAAIREGEHLIEKLLSSPIHPEIKVHVLAGNHPYFNGVRGEQDAESDGLVFVESVLFTGGIAPVASQVKRKDVLPLNHLDLLYHSDAHQWVLDGLDSNEGGL